MKKILVAVVLLGVQEAPWTPFNDPGNRRHPERAARVDVQHYRVSLLIDDTKRELEGVAGLDLTLMEDDDRVELDAEGMTFRRVGLVDGAELKHRAEGGRLVVQLGRKARKGGTVRLFIEYTARPRAGFFFTGPDESDPSRPWMAWTQGETEYNRHWFPCYDYPNDRATSEMILTVRDKYRTLSNGTLVSQTRKDGWRTDHWKMDVPHVTYLSSVIVGEFDAVEETLELSGRRVPLQYLAPKGWHTEEEIRHAFGRTASMTRFFSERTGADYPYSKYAQTVVVDFIWGGMENISATTIHDRTIIPKRAWGDRDSDGLIAHELAHQWFGDLVTCRSWAHTWLNEGFATYFEALWQEQVGGREALVEDLEGGLGGIFGDSARYERPTVCDVYTHPDDVFDSYIYARGAWVLHMLRGELGDEVWWKGIRRYVETCRAKCVTTDEFRIAMEEASGRDLRPFFDQWFTKVGHPELKVEDRWDEGSKTLTLKVTQTQPVRKLECAGLSTERPVFRVPIDVEIETTSGRKTHRIEIREREEEFTFRLDAAPEIIDFDRDIWILKSLDWTRTDADLATQLERDDQPWHRRGAARKLAGSADSVPALARALSKDPSRGVRLAAAESLGSIDTPAAREALLEALGTDDARLRAAILRALGNHSKVDSVAAALRRVLDGDASPACREAAAASLGRRGASSFDTLRRAAEQYAKDELVLPGVLSGLLETGETAALDLFVRYTGYGPSTPIRRRATECLGDALTRRKDDPEFRKKGLPSLVKLLDDPSFRVRTAAIEKIGAAGDESVIPAIEARLAKELDQRVVRNLRTAARKIREAR